MKIAFLGLGRMGTELALHLLEAGHPLTVWNRTRAAADALEAEGAQVAGTAADAVNGAEIVFTTLFGPETVREVVLNGDLPFGRQATWIDITTVAPDDASQFEAWAEAKGILYAHSPVIGSLAPARARALGVLLGGSPRATSIAAPFVSLWADAARFHIYDNPRKAATGKLVANLALAVSLQGLVEALRLGRGGGMTTGEVLDQLQEKTMLQPIVAMKGDVIRNGTFSETQFSVDALAKDAALMTQTAGGGLPALSAAAASLNDAVERGQGDWDISAVAGIL